MRKQIDYDALILRELKGAPTDQIANIIYAIVNDQYDFGDSPLSKISLTEISLRLEKILIKTNKKYTRENKRPYYRYNHEIFHRHVSRFIQNIYDVKAKDINRRDVVARDYDFLIKKANANHKTRGGKAGISFAVTLTTIALIAIIRLATWGYDAVENDPELYNELIDPPRLEEFLAEYQMDVNSQLEQDLNVEINDNSVDYEDTLVIVQDNEETEVEITNEQRINWILERFNITTEQWRIIVAIITAEAAPNSYQDAFHVANTLYNRTISERWSNCPQITRDFRNEKGIEFDGNNIFHHAIAPGQFYVYAGNGRYQEFLDRTDLPQFQAAIDFFFYIDINGPTHNYLQFRSYDSNPRNHTLLTNGGNRFFDILTDEDRLDIDQQTRGR